MKRQEIINRYNKIMSRSTKVLGDIAKEIAVTDETSTVYWTKMNARIQSAYNDVMLSFSAETDKSIADWYKQEYKSEFRKIKNAKLNNGATVNKSLNKNATKQTKQAIVDATKNIFLVGILSGEKVFKSVATDTQKYNGIRKRVPSFRLPDTYKRNLRAILDGKYITVVDKNGRPRTYNAKYYAEMVVRTQMSEAHTSAALNVAIDTNNDLVKVSDHNTSTEICQQFEGNVYSLSGKSKEYPKATALPPYHPNCKHYITIYK